MSIIKVNIKYKAIASLAICYDKLMTFYVMQTFANRLILALKKEKQAFQKFFVDRVARYQAMPL